ncbi:MULTISPECIES: transposase [unclassified Kaistella]|uniref:transposase n=1 Tax=unclassified Kaistella TaxID=2762626 RepID=UPI0027353F97|nr:MULTISPECIES: transposase [unclassified Kaistella]MDP2454091.1 transposase [Kaistella sp. SH11-4b]MDP2457148.1 transposase [Kaistella sp. SH40-3]MDP2459906.1 transposase [Kaistella sp. SH19-2b]
MPQSLVKNYVHIVFITKHRNDFIDEKIENELCKYIATICKDFESTAIQIGGTDNHIQFYVCFQEKLR